MPVLHDAAGGLRWITVTQENGTRYLYLDGCEEGAMALDSEAPVFHYLWFHKLSHLIGLPLRRRSCSGPAPSPLRNASPSTTRMR